MPSVSGGFGAGEATSRGTVPGHGQRSWSGAACRYSWGVVAVVIPPILVVRRKVRQPTGVVVGETRRVCHLVPVLVPESREVPVVLRAYCGLEIARGAAELLDGISGMPCEECLARSPIPAFEMLRGLSPAAPQLGPGTGVGRRDVAQWWEWGLRPEQRITARFVLLILLQDPTRYRSLAEIAVWLELDAHTVDAILAPAVPGWVLPIDTGADEPWADRRYRLTERGAVLARRVLADGLAPTFTHLATQLGLDITVIGDPDIPDLSDPGGCVAAPTPLHPPGPPLEPRTRPAPTSTRRHHHDPPGCSG